MVIEGMFGRESPWEELGHSKKDPNTTAKARKKLEENSHLVMAGNPQNFIKACRGSGILKDSPGEHYELEKSLLKQEGYTQVFEKGKYVNLDLANKQTIHDHVIGQYNLYVNGIFDY